MQVGIIGTGKHGSRYASHIVNDIDGLELAAISRRSFELTGQTAMWNCRGYRDWRELIADKKVEAVISVTPPSLNLDIARACVHAGKPLLIEKPLAVNGKQAEEIVDLFEEADISLTVAQTLRFNQVIRLFRDRLTEIGDLYSFSANQRLEPSTLAWHSQPELAGAGVSFHTAIHVFDALYFITGFAVQRVMAVTAQCHNSSLEDMMIALVELENGVRGTVDCSKVGDARSGRFEFVGRQGQLVGDQIYNYCEKINHSSRTVLEAGAAVSTIIHLLVDWRDFMAGKKENPVPGRAGLEAVRCCQACLESARTGQWVTVSDDR